MAKLLKIDMHCSNAAFDEMPGEEIARILGAVALKIQGAQPGDELAGPVRDSNGNRVGEWSLDLSDDD